MLLVKLPVVNTIQAQGNKFAMGVENEATGDSKLMTAPQIINNYPAKSPGISEYRKIEQDNCFIIQQIDNKARNIFKLSVNIFSLHFFFPRTKLHIPPDICYLRMTDIETIMTIFG